MISLWFGALMSSVFSDWRHVFIQFWMLFKPSVIGAKVLLTQGQVSNHVKYWFFLLVIDYNKTQQSAKHMEVTGLGCHATCRGRFLIDVLLFPSMHFNTWTSCRAIHKKTRCFVQQLFQANNNDNIKSGNLYGWIIHAMTSAWKYHIQSNVKLSETSCSNKDEPLLAYGFVIISIDVSGMQLLIHVQTSAAI